MYIGYADIYLGSTGVDAYTPLTTFNNGGLYDAAGSLTANGDGTYTATLTAAAWEAAWKMASFKCKMPPLGRSVHFRIQSA